MKGVLIDSIDGTKIEFQYIPEKINRDDSPKYAQFDVIGRSHPLYQFVSGGERKVSFELGFHWEQNAQEVEQKISWLRSITYPDLGGGSDIKKAPHPVILLVGELFKDTIFILKSIKTEYHTLFDQASGLPCYAKASLELAEYQTVNINFKTIRRFSEQ